LASFFGPHSVPVIGPLCSAILIGTVTSWQFTPPGSLAAAIGTPKPTTPTNVAVHVIIKLRPLNRCLNCPNTVDPLVGIVAVLANCFLPTDVVFTFLLNSSGAIAVVVYFAIAATHIAARRRLGPARSANLPVPMWAYPYVSIAVVVALTAVLAGMAFSPSSRQPLLLTMLVTALAVAAGLAWQRRGPGSELRSAAPRPGARYIY
jgi:hypothetical protein